jgi:site-specific DNA-cytosine methylase
MNVLSLFDGISCGRVALERAGIPVTNYFASEIDKWAIKISQNNWPNIKQIGDVRSVKYSDGVLHTEEGKFDVGKIDLVLAGSPCQSISGLGDGSGLDGKSGLFYEFFRLLNEIRSQNPNVKFILENVSGKKEALDEISNKMNVEPVLINSNDFSAQNRRRLYWTNIEISEWVQKDIKLVDVLEKGIPEDATLSQGRMRWLLSDKGQATVEKKYAQIDPERAGCLTARSDASWNSNYVTRDGQITRLTPVEYERLQTLPDGYTEGVSNSQRYKTIGNGWTVDVIAHILKGLK